MGFPNLEHHSAALKHRQRRGGTTFKRRHRRTVALLRHRQRRTAALESLLRRHRHRRGTERLTAVAWVPQPVRRSETRMPCTTALPPAAAVRRLCPVGAAAAAAVERDLAAGAIEPGRRRLRPCRSSGVPRRRLRRRLRLRRNTRRLGVPKRRNLLPARPHPTMRLRPHRPRLRRRRRPQHRQQGTRTAAVPTATAVAVVPTATAAICTPTAASGVVEVLVPFLSPQAGKRRSQATDGRFSWTTTQDQPTGSDQYERKPRPSGPPVLIAVFSTVVVQQRTGRSLGRLFRCLPRVCVP